MRGRAWTDAERAASIQADLRHLTDQRLAAWQRRELALQAKVRAMEATHAAHADAARAVEEIDNHLSEISEQTDALAALIPKPRNQP